jgi:hypothetical protein
MCSLPPLFRIEGKGAYVKATPAGSDDYFQSWLQLFEYKNGKVLVASPQTSSINSRRIPLVSRYVHAPRLAAQHSNSTYYGFIYFHRVSSIEKYFSKVLNISLLLTINLVILKSKIK